MAQPTDHLTLDDISKIVLAFCLVLDLVLVWLHRRNRPDWAGCSHDLRSRTWAWSDGGRVLAAVVALHIFLILSISFGAYLFSMHPQDLLVPSLVMQTLVFHGIGLTLLFATMSRGHLTWNGAFGFQSGRVLRDAGVGFLLYLAFTPPVVLANMVSTYVLTSLGIDTGPQDVVRIFMTPGHSIWLQFYLAVIAVVVAPFFEEFIFRGVAFPLLARQSGVHRAIWSTSILFALMHFHLPSLLPLLVMSIAFSVGYLYGRSIIVPIVMHAAFNGVNLAVTVWLQ